MRNVFLGSALVLSIASLTGCIIKDNDDGTTTGKETTSTSDGAGNVGGSNEGGGGMTTDGGGGNTTTSMSSSSGGSAPLGQCDTATLYAGDPFFDGELSGWDPKGQPLLADPPLRYRHLAKADGHLYIDTQSELWLTDGGNVKRAAGDENEPDTQYQPTGACSTVRFLINTGIATLPNGNVVVADSRGNGIIEISDPAGPNCSAKAIAGNPDKTLDEDIFDGLPAEGDVDGPGASARFDGPAQPTTDAAGNIYFIDQGNSKIKKIAADASRTVTTLYAYPDANDTKLPLSMTVIGDKLFVSGASVAKEFIWQLDTKAPGDPTILYYESGHWEELDSSQQAIIYALGNDGTDLIGGSGKGYIFRISATTGKELGVIAGMGPIVDFPDSSSLDVKNPIATNALPLKGYGVNEGGMLVDGTDVLWIGVGGNGLGYHIFDIDCH